MIEQVDKAYDYILYTLSGCCFMAATFFVLKAVYDTMDGWQGVTGQIWNAALLVGLGIVVGVFFIGVKSYGGKA